MPCPDLTGRSHSQVVAILAFDMLVMQTELLGRGRVRTDAEIRSERDVDGVVLDRRRRRPAALLAGWDGLTDPR